MKRKLLAITLALTFTYAAHLVSQETPGRIGDSRGLTETMGPFGEFDRVLPIGSPAPDFTLDTPDGESVSLKSLRGKTVVLEFGART